VDVALLVACLSVGGFFLLGAHGGVMLFGIVGIPALGVGYAALGGAHATAIMSGLRRQGFERWPAVLVALLLAYVPVIGGAAAVRGAMAGWGWATARGLVRFFGPLVVMAAPLFSE
jgi:branched-subunit amino acid ABC-type transport system permease component